MLDPGQKKKGGYLRGVSKASGKAGYLRGTDLEIKMRDRKRANTRGAIQEWAKSKLPYPMAKNYPNWKPLTPRGNRGRSK